MRKRQNKAINVLTAGGIIFGALLLIGGGVVGYMAIHPTTAHVKEMVVYKSSDCECCNRWVGYLEGKGFHVSVIKRDDMDQVKADLGVPDDMQSCHTAKIGGYVVEGHVPAEAIDRLLAEHPKVIGIAAPGMPPSAPGMDGPKEPYTVYSFDTGHSSAFAEF